MEKGDGEEPAQGGGSRKEVGGGCQTQKEGSETRTEVPFSLEKESGVTFLGFRKKKKKKKK